MHEENIANLREEALRLIPGTGSAGEDEASTWLAQCQRRFTADLRSGNGMKADAVKQFVQELMSGTHGPVLQAEQIFPVSSRPAYWVNRARHEVERHGSLGGGAGLPGAGRQPPGLPRGPALQPSAACGVRGQRAADGGICEPSSRWMRRVTTSCTRCFRASSPGY